MAKKRLFITLLLSMAFAIGQCYAQNQPVFLGDINQEEGGSNPRNFVKVGSNVYFIASATIGFEVWRTDGTEEGTFALDWFNDQYDRTDWKFLIPYDDSRFLIQTHDALYLTTGIEGSLQMLSSQAQDENASVRVNNDNIFWAEPNESERRDVIKSSNQSASEEVLLQDYELVRFVNLDNHMLIVCIDGAANFKTFISDGTENGTALFAEQNVMAADEDATKVVYSALDLDGELFQLYSIDKVSAQIEQLTFLNETAIPNYSRIEPIILLRGDVIFFTKQVERQGRYWFLSELHRLENGQVSFVGDESDFGFEVDIIVENDSALTVLSGQGLFSINDAGEYLRLESSSSLLNDNKLNNATSYYHYDGSKLFYLTGASGDSELIVSTESRLGTKKVKSGSKFAEAIAKSPNFFLSRKSAGIVVLGNLVIAAGREGSDTNELWSIDWQTGEEALIKNISHETKALAGADFKVYNDKLYVVSEGRIWATDGTPEGTIGITFSDFSRFTGTPRFVSGFDDLYILGAIPNEHPDFHALIKIENEIAVKVWEGVIPYGNDDLYYLFRAGAEAVFLYGQFNNYALSVGRDDVRLRLHYSIRNPLFARGSNGYLNEERFLSLPDRIFFRGWTRELGFEPWVIDIDQYEARPLGDLNPESHSHPIGFTKFNNKIVFRSSESDFRQSLFYSDGTADGTSIYFTDFIDADETKEATISIPKLINGNLYFTSFYEGTQRLYSANNEDEFQVLEEKEQTHWSGAPELIESGYNLILHDWENLRFYDRVTGEAGELDWSIIPTRDISIGNYFYESLTYEALTYGTNFGALGRWNKQTLEEEVFSDDPNKELPVITLGRKLIVLKYAEGFGHELWAVDVGLQDRLAHLEEMEVRQGETFLPYISDIETADFTYTVDDQSAITQQEANGWFTAEKEGQYNMTLTFPETEIYNGGAVDITVNVVGRFSQTIIFDEVESKSFNDDPFELQATGGASGNPIVFSSSDPSIASVDGHTVTVNKVGTVTITANQVGNDDYQDAEPVERTLVITKIQEDIAIADIAGKSFGDDDFILEVSGTSRVDQVVFSSSDEAVVKVTGATAEIVGTGQVTLSATIAEDNNHALSTSSIELTIAKAAQQISFDALPGLIYSPGLEKTLVALGGGSGNPIVFTSSDPAIASIDGNTVSIHQAGIITITADQSGNDNYFNAQSSTRVLIISNPEENISIADLSDKTFGDADFTIEVTGTSRPDEVLFSSSDQEVVKVVGNKAEIIAAGEVTLSATLPSNDIFNESTTSIKIEIARAAQNLVFEELEEVTYSPALNMSLNATGGPTGNPILFTSSDASIATVVDQTVLIIKAGVVSITATQEGTANYLPASVTRQLTINKSPQSVTFPALPDQVYGGNAVVTLEAFASSGADVNYLVDSDIIAISGIEVEILGAGTVEIGAYQPGTENYLTSDIVYQTLSISRASQSIVFDPLPESLIFKDTTFELSAAGGGSQNPVVFESLNTDVAIVSGHQLTIVGAGSAVVKASQSGNENYMAAPSITQDLVVSKAVSTLELEDIPELTFGDPPVELAIQASGSQIPTISSDNEDVIAVDGHVLEIIGAGSIVLTVTLPESGNYQAAEIIREIVVAKASQEISFSIDEGVVIGDAVALEASASSGLPVSYSLIGSAAIIEQGQLVILQAGEITITAEQNGDINYEAAESVSIAFSIESAPTVASVDPLPNLKIYPNPTGSELHIELPNHQLQSIRITDLSGKVWFDQKSKSKWSTTTLDVSNLPNGLYILGLETTSGEQTTRKVLIQR